VSGKNYISVKNATLGYEKGNTAILSAVDLDFYGGDFAGIVGLNGTGKSTLLKTLAGFIPPLHGEVLIESVSIMEQSLKALAKKVAVVLTEKIGGFNLTTYDAVAAGQIPYTNAFNQLKQANYLIVEAALNTCNLQLHRNKPLNELSDGLFQKTIIAKALAQQTPVMLLDEPSAFLDYASKHELFGLLKKLATEERKCILISSHDLDLVLRYCNRLCIVCDGGVTMEEIANARQNPSFLAIGGGFI
jgi:iron complex transport system ATP-binding protein